jgi:hypothetical protein
MTRRKVRSDPIFNTYIEDRGRQYRICRRYGRVMLVALRGKRFERLLDIDGRRARALIRKESAQ